MRYRVRTEEIYDAALDDEAFARLPGLLARSLGARSAVLHWGHGKDECVEIVDNGYFLSEHMLQYDRHFAACDLWAEAMNLPSVANQGWNCEQLIPRRAYEMSRIYNEWVRPIGDDTFHCLGAVIQAGWGCAKVGLHRGRSQGSFDEDTVKVFNEDLGHLRRMLNIRARLGTLDAQKRLAEHSLHALGNGVLSLSISGRLLHANAAAERILLRGDALSLSNGYLFARRGSDQAALRAALALAADPASTQGSGLLICRRDGGSYMLSLIAASTGSTGRHIVAVITEPGFKNANVEGRLRTIFSLTRSEAELARRLAEGASTEEVAVERGTAISTIRTQLKTVAAKLGCSRQAEIVAIVKDLPLLLPAECPRQLTS